MVLCPLPRLSQLSQHSQLVMLFCLQCRDDLGHFVTDSHDFRHIQLSLGTSPMSSQFTTDCIFKNYMYTFLLISLFQIYAISSFG